MLHILNNVLFLKVYTRAGNYFLRPCMH